MLAVARDSWSTEQGSHGPIVLVTGLWLLWRTWPRAAEVSVTPPVWRAALVFAPFALLLIFARIVRVLEVEGFLMYGTLIACLYAIVGGKAVRQLWFPLLYLSFVFPLPDTVIAAITLPLKDFISRATVSLLSWAGYPIGGYGVTIMIGPYELLVAAACSGLNSIVSLSALALFYLYVRHQGDWRAALPSLIMIVPIAIAANLLRVLILVLLTYYRGDAVAQGFLHSMAGMFMFVVALALLMIWDALAARAVRRFGAAAR